MKELITILKQFETKKDEWKGTWDEEAVAECFKDCAKEILCNGYFLVNNKYIIDLGAIELYYHEEGEGDNKIKDYAMYHIPERYLSPKIEGVIKLEKKLPYFKPGSFNLHQSGVDVTFEKENEYRASFLIRAYRVLVAEEGGMYPKNPDTKYDVHSTHIFDDMFYMGCSFSDNGNPTTIKWKTYPGKCTYEPKQCTRENIVECNYDEDKKDVFKVLYKEQDYKTNTKLYTLKNNKVYKKDLRLWKFTIIK